MFTWQIYSGMQNVALINMIKEKFECQNIKCFWKKKILLFLENTQSKLRVSNENLKTYIRL